MRYVAASVVIDKQTDQLLQPLRMRRGLINDDQIMEIKLMISVH